MTRLKAGNTNVFKRRWEVKAKATAVALVIDQSGSMAYGDRWPLAMALEHAATRVFHKAGVPFTVLAFSATTTVKKAANERLSAVQLRATAYALAPEGTTGTSQAILHAAAQLASVNATRKMILVVTDGDSDEGAAALDSAVRKVRHDGIDAVNALIIDPTFDAEYPQVSYDNAIEVDAASLPTEGLKMLTRG